MTARPPPTNRNFSGTTNNPRHNRPNLIHIFIFTLLFLSVGLLCSAIYLSKQLDLNDNALSSTTQIRLGAAKINDNNNAVPNNKNRGVEIKERTAVIRAPPPTTKDDDKKKVQQSTANVPKATAKILPYPTTT
ncbi:hypothetical protein QTG54_010124 [Skeletonema marinoi]|uniref:Uncharacterized protein n=1 Tax=Skeletonema marinoi TaxID=267567 RepID=A0AAD9DAP3_9STRA|nr:hypothetical protein QTG54_010124 [Skeletonema marinoi]